MTTATWNTGRLYTNAGQTISATKHGDGVITFMDNSRGVYGELRSKCHRELAASNLKALVMQAYDRGEYDGTSRAYHDAMLADGCNRPSA